MKLCFPVKENQGLQSQVFGHFGSAPLLLVVDTENQEIKELTRTSPADQPGRARLAQLLSGESVDALVVGSIGRGAFGRLQGAGVKVYQAAGATIADNLLCLADKRLKNVDGAELCTHGRQGVDGKRHHGHAHGGDHGCGCH